MRDNDAAVSICIVSVLILLLLMCVGCVNWYKAGQQQQVWDREGIHLTRWEILWGAKPAERVITVK